MTLHEIALVGTVVAVLLLGAAVKHYRDAHRLVDPAASAATPKPKPVTPPYVRQRQ
jgi:hypothetical protein